MSYVCRVCTVAMLVYVSDTKQRDKAEFNDRLVKDRHTTARNLRNYYLRCLEKLLDADFEQYVTFFNVHLVSTLPCMVLKC